MAREGYSLLPISQLIYRENYTIDHAGRQICQAQSEQRNFCRFFKKSVDFCKKSDILDEETYGVFCALCKKTKGESMV